MAYFDKYGVEFSDDSKTLVKCPKDFQGEYIIPDGVTQIKHWAFLDCKEITSIVISQDVCLIGYGTFWGCSKLEKLSIGKNVMFLSRQNFLFCDNLTNILIDSSNPYFYTADNILYRKENKYGQEVITFISYLGRINGDFSIPEGVIEIENSAFRECSNLASITLPPTLTRIGECAFAGCSGIKSITIPQNVKNIGQDAFRGCSRLSTVIWDAKDCSDFSKHSTPFFHKDYDKEYYDICSQITSFSFGDNVERVPAFLCCGLTNLTKVTIPENVVKLGNNVFARCTGLKQVNVLSKKIIYDGKDIFIGCSSLEAIIIPSNSNFWWAFVDNQYSDFLKEYDSRTNTLKKVKTKSFWDPWGGCLIELLILASFVIGYVYMNNSKKEEKQKRIVTEQLEYKRTHTTRCGVIYRLDSVNAAACAEKICLDSITHATIVIPDSIVHNNVTYIVNGVSFSSDTLHPLDVVLSNNIERVYFSFSRGIRKVTLPNNMTTLDRVSFRFSDIEEIVLPPRLLVINSGVFSQCEKLRSIQIPEGVKCIKDEAFSYCRNLSTIHIPNSVVSIGNEAFALCQKLDSVIIPSGVVSIGDKAFQMCHNIKYLEIGPNVIEHRKAFDFISPDQEYTIKIHCDIPPEFSFNISSIDDCCLLVPENSYELYKKSPYYKGFKQIKIYQTR